jgi:hypothetical protein
VAAYPVTGPIDVIEPGRTGWLDDDLRRAALRCLELDRHVCVEAARQFSWARCAAIVRDHLAPIG